MAGPRSVFTAHIKQTNSTTRIISDIPLSNLGKGNIKNNNPHSTQVYKLINSEQKNSADLRFCVFGCMGTGGTDQKAVAKLLQEKVATMKESEKPEFIIILGDNFYNNGVDDPKDKAFNNNFHNIYYPENSALRGIPCFVIPGNHDHNLHRGFSGKTNGLTHFKKIEAQIQHTYNDNNIHASYNDISRENVVAMFDSKVLDLAKLPQWNMPRRAYAITKNAVIMLMLDSSAYVQGYLKFLESKDENNQATWVDRLEKKAKSEGKRVIFCMHHPLVTAGTHSADKDLEIYLAKEEIEKLRKNGIAGENYNQVLYEIMLKKQKLEPDLVCSAHDHSMAYFLEKVVGLRQLISGGGGGPLQPRTGLKEGSDLICSVIEHGFVMATVPAEEKEITLELVGVKGSHLKIKHLSGEFIREDRVEEKDNDIKILREIISVAYQKYFAFLREQNKKTLSHGQEGIANADFLMNFINRVKPLSVEDIVCQIQSLHDDRVSKPSKHSLVTFIDKEFQDKFKINYASYRNAKYPDLMPMDDCTTLRRVW